MPAMAWFFALLITAWLAAGFYLLLNGRQRSGVMVLIALVVVGAALLIVAVVAGFLDSLTSF